MISVLSTVQEKSTQELFNTNFIPYSPKICLNTLENSWRERKIDIILSKETRMSIEKREEQREREFDRLL